MSEFEVHDRPPSRQTNDDLPAAMLLAIVCGVGVALLWVVAALMLIALVQGFGNSASPWLLGCLFGVAGGIAGVVGCARGWVWVRWAALLQALVVTVVLCTFVGWMPFVPWVVALFITYAGLQFLPSSHRWYHPVPLWKQREAAGLDS